MFVCLFTCFDESVIFYSQISQWRICDFFCFRFVLYSLCSIFSFGLCFFFVFLFNFYFLLGLFVCLFACFDDSVIFYSQVSQWRSCDFFFVLSLFYILFVLYSLSACAFFFVFLFNFYFLLGLFVCLFACFDDSVIFYSQVSQWRSCDFFFVLSLFYILFRRKKKSRSCLSLHSLTTDSNSLY